MLRSLLDAEDAPPDDDPSAEGEDSCPVAQGESRRSIAADWATRLSHSHPLFCGLDAKVTQTTEGLP